MRANRRKDTAPELAVRSELHRRGLRFRVDHPVRVVGVARPIRPDVVFPRQRLVLFIDGCWWHGCPEHSTEATTNSEYWRTKLAENRARDERHTKHLTESDWTVVRAWTHEDPSAVAARVVQALGRHGRIHEPPVRQETSARRLAPEPGVRAVPDKRR
jgi:DNA mismatch endonuclease (patch repair protein)